MEIQTPTGKQLDRRKILAAGGLLSLVALAKFWGVGRMGRLFGGGAKRPTAINCVPAGKSNTVKLLAQDGRLVEVDLSRSTVLKKKISSEELRTWVKQKPL